jgi:2'-5' RNA ligase
MEIKKDYFIPLSKLGYYSLGICEIDQASQQEVRNILNPVEKYLVPLMDSHPIHVTCRYLDYYDVVTAEEISEVRAKVKPIIENYLPLSADSTVLTAGWQQHPERQRKLLMLDLENEKLKALHQNLLAATPGFPVFSGIEKEQFRPHLTLGEVREEFKENIPAELTDFIRDFKKRIKLTFTKGFIWTPQGMEKL